VFSLFFEREAVIYIIGPAIPKVNTAGAPHFLDVARFLQKSRAKCRKSLDFIRCCVKVKVSKAFPVFALVKNLRF
jgi:hypothetical protein